VPHFSYGNATQCSEGGRRMLLGDNTVYVAVILRPISVFCSLDFGCISSFMFLHSMDRPWGLQESETPRFQDGQYVKIAKLSATFTRQEIFVVAFFVSGRVHSRAILQSEGLCKRKIPITH